MLIGFVCTANRCRSPMAEAFARIRHGASGIRFASAGTLGSAGQPATTGTIDTMAEVGLDLSGHRSTALDDLMARHPDLVYVMTAEHRDQVLARYADLDGRVLLLRPDGLPVEDPYLGGPDEYRAGRDEIAAAVAARAADWRNRH